MVGISSPHPQNRFQLGAMTRVSILCVCVCAFDLILFGALHICTQARVICRSGLNPKPSSLIGLRVLVLGFGLGALSLGSLAFRGFGA